LTAFPAGNADKSPSKYGPADAWYWQALDQCALAHAGRSLLVSAGIPGRAPACRRAEPAQRVCHSDLFDSQSLRGRAVFTAAPAVWSGSRVLPAYPRPFSWKCWGTGGQMILGAIRQPTAISLFRRSGRPSLRLAR